MLVFFPNIFLPDGKQFSCSRQTIPLLIFLFKALLPLLLVLHGFHSNKNAEVVPTAS